MDLNRPPNPFSLSCTISGIRFVTRRKLDCREVLVQKYGEEWFESMIASEEPFLIPSITLGMIIIFILV